MKLLRMRRVTARYHWDRMEVSFWFFPVVMSIGAILLAWVLYWVDSWLPNEILQESRFVLSGTPDETRTMLITTAGTVLATAGVVFTLLTLPLSTVAAQYGSRLLRVFLGDRTTQIVLGTFVATFVYCVTAALSILPTNIEADGPQITATIGLVLELACFASLILLVQHISTMLQAPNIAAAAGAELRDVVLAETPEQVEKSDELREDSVIPTNELIKRKGYPIRVNRSGSIQYIDPEYIVTLAHENDLVIRLLCKPGHIVWRDMPVALVWPSENVDKKMEQLICNAIRIGNNRTPTQDVAYGVNQLVEMAVRAMSAAINDPFTAMTCLNYIGEGVALFIKQGEKKPYYYDQESKLRLMLEPVTFGELLDGAFNMLRHACCNDASVLLHMLDVIQTISRETNSTKVNQELCRHINFIHEEALVGTMIGSDRDRISQRCMELINALQS